jgi:hypothetical protein
MALLMTLLMANEYQEIFRVGFKAQTARKTDNITAICEQIV